jgi:hypothetical protein
MTSTVLEVTDCFPVALIFEAVYTIGRVLLLCVFIDIIGGRTLDRLHLEQFARLVRPWLSGISGSG